MARLCVRIVPNPHPDLDMQKRRTQAGDVVCVVEDGHVFSYAEMNNGQYHIIDIPGNAEDFMYLCDPVLDDAGDIRLRRGKTLNLAALGITRQGVSRVQPRSNLEARTISRI